MPVKQVRFLAGLALLGAVGACTATTDEPSSQTGVDALSMSTPAAIGAAVKATTGHSVVGPALPIYEPGGAAPAFYEVNLAPGWAVVTSELTPRVIEWNDSGKAPSARLDVVTRLNMARLYRLDTAVYVATSKQGKALGTTAKSLVKIDRSGSTPQFVAVTPDDALRTFAAVAASDGPPLVGNTPPATTCTVPGDVPSYTQLNANQAPNTTACFSGCGPTAWATVFGWASRRAVENAAADSSFAPLFPSGEAPLTMNDDVANLSMQINGLVKTMCVQGEGATTPWSMANVQSIVPAGVSIDVHYNFLMTPDDGVRDQVIAALCDGRPAIIGIGTMFGGDGHFPIAKGYDNGKFMLEMGWGGDGNGWYDATTWFIGSVHH